MSDPALLALYARVWADDPAGREASVVRHMRAVLDAPDLDAATAAVEWWLYDEDGRADLRRRVARARRLGRGV